MGIYPKNMSREDIAKLSKEEKDMYLYKWIMAKPTPQNICVVMSILPLLPAEFWQFIVGGIVENCKLDKVEPTRERIEEDINIFIEDWATHLDEFFNCLALFVEETKPKVLVKVKFFS